MPDAAPLTTTTPESVFMIAAALNASPPIATARTERPSRAWSASGKLLDFVGGQDRLDEIGNFEARLDFGFEPGFSGLDVFETG
jgi:hypothetical protein